MLHFLTLTMCSLVDFVLKVLIYDFFVITLNFIVLLTDEPIPVATRSKA